MLGWFSKVRGSSDPPSPPQQAAVPSWVRQVVRLLVPASGRWSAVCDSHGQCRASVLLKGQWGSKGGKPMTCWFLKVLNKVNVAGIREITFQGSKAHTGDRCLGEERGAAFASTGWLTARLFRRQTSLNQTLLRQRHDVPITPLALASTTNRLGCCRTSLSVFRREDWFSGLGNVLGIVWESHLGWW